MVHGKSYWFTAAYCNAVNKALRLLAHRTGKNSNALLKQLIKQELNKVGAKWIEVR